MNTAAAALLIILIFIAIGGIILKSANRSKDNGKE